MDKGELTGAIFIDLSKAFDTIGHSVIINKLPNFGTSETAPNWVSSYLFGLYQRVRFKGKLSSFDPIYCGAPQGSILGPPTFLVNF